MFSGASAGLAAGLRLLSRHHEDPLTSFMRGDVTRNLGIIPKGVSWGSQSDQVFKNLAGDFMVDSIAAVDAVLETGEPQRSIPKTLHLHNFAWLDFRLVHAGNACYINLE